MHSNTEINSQQTDSSIQISAEAISEIKRLIANEKEDELFLRLGVSSGGCSGMSYEMSFDNSPDDNDQALEFDGLTLRVDKEAMPFLEGTRIDYSNNLMGGGFKFSNPNAQNSCGCGSSFSC